MIKEIVCPQCQQPIIADIKIKTKTKRSIPELVNAHKMVIEDIIIDIKKR